MQFHIPRQLDKELQKEKSLIDRLAILAGVIGPIATIPQAISVWSGATEGVSFIMWALFFLGSIILFFYSILYRLKSMLITQAAWLLMEIVVITGLLVKS